MMLHAPRRGGFSLTEVLLAIGVIAIGLLGVAVMIPLAQHQAAEGLRDDRAGQVGRAAMREFFVRGFHDESRWPPAARGGDVCIDPLLLSHAGGAANSFPYSGVPVLPRISVTNGPGSNSFMSAAQARQVFVNQDGLSLEVSNLDPTLPPEQMDVTGVTWNNAATKRQVDGQFSWFATVTRTNDPRLRRVSIAVCHQRPAAILNNIGSEPAGERVVTVDLLTGGFGGGEAELRSVDPVDLDIEPGEWIFMYAPGAPPNQTAWYRVAHRAIDPSDPTVAAVTLDGPDWNANRDPNPVAVVVDGVVAVHERVIPVGDHPLFSY